MPKSAKLCFQNTLRQILRQIIADHGLHAKWLNSLSYLENCGARKIAACEHPTLVKEEMLKHAAEEFRHAHHLKRQIDKLPAMPLETYARETILGGTKTLHYLRMLDLRAASYLTNEAHLSKRGVQEAAYLLVTYAIELRAEQLYSLYDEELRQARSKISVKALLLEEKEHLAEMRHGLTLLPSGHTHAQHVCLFEEQLYQQWLYQVNKEIYLQ